MSEIVDPFDRPAEEVFIPETDPGETLQPEAVEGEVAEFLAKEPADEEIPPEPHEARSLLDMTLAEREAFRLASMTPEQRERYDKATAEIMANPAVAAFATEEARRAAAKEETKAAFLAAYRKKQKQS